MSVRLSINPNDYVGAILALDSELTIVSKDLLDVPTESYTYELQIVVLAARHRDLMLLMSSMYDLLLYAYYPREKPKQC